MRSCSLLQTDPRRRRQRCGGLAASALSGVSPWAPGSWQLTLDFGRDENDSSAEAISKDWGADNGRLALSFDVDVSADVPNRIEDSSVESLWLGGKPTGSIECISQDGEQHCSTYINSDGQQRVQIANGLWRIEPPLPLLPTYTNTLAGQSSTLRFYLTMKTAIARNSINLPADQLLFLQANAFREEEYVRGIRKRPLIMRVSLAHSSNFSSALTLKSKLFRDIAPVRIRQGRFAAAARGTA